MVYEFKLPDIGEGVAEGEVVKWLVTEGAEVKENQPLVEIMTDKVNVEIPSPRRGTVHKLMAKEGEVIKVGQPLITILEEGELAPPQGPTTPEPKKETKITIEPTPPIVPSRIPTEPAKPHEILATPATRKLARDLGIDLTQVQGNGPSGRITNDDVNRFRGTGLRSQVVVTTRAPSGREERVPLRGVRRKIAEHMVKSKATTAQVTHVDEIDMTELVQLRERAKGAEKGGVKITYLPFIIKALIPALRQFPYLNATLDEEKGEIVLKKYYNFGIATDMEQGLVVPVIKDAERKSIAQLASEISMLSERARSGQLTLDEVQGSTFTITNIGGVGGVFATPIINYPEVAILGVHKITRRPVVALDDQIVIREMTYLSLSFDHRVLDGVMAAKFMNATKQYLEDPKLLLLETD